MALITLTGRRRARRQRRKTGFAYADQISPAALEQSAQAARTIVRDTGDGRVKTLGEVQHAALYTSIDPLQSMSREEKLDILRRVDKVARAGINACRKSLPA